MKRIIRALLPPLDVLVTTPAPHPGGLRMSTNDKLVSPEQGVTTNLASVDPLLRQIQGRQPTDVTMAHMAIAQVYATCAVAHALRELTEELRMVRESE